MIFDLYGFLAYCTFPVNSYNLFKPEIEYPDYVDLGFGGIYLALQLCREKSGGSDTIITGFLCGD